MKKNKNIDILYEQRTRIDDLENIDDHYYTKYKEQLELFSLINDRAYLFFRAVA